jgi:hypothetical protein
MKSLYDTLFTEYPGHLGYAPAVATITVVVAVCCGIIYGGVHIGMAAFAKHAANVLIQYA